MPVATRKKSNITKQNTHDKTDDKNIHIWHEKMRTMKLSMRQYKYRLTLHHNIKDKIQTINQTVQA